VLLAIRIAELEAGFKENSYRQVSARCGHC
jgi:hypothetical protein